MLYRPSPVRRLVIVASAIALSLALAGCESLEKMNPFAEKEKILPGARTPVFPEGVPGVDYSAPPPQPASPGGYGAIEPTPETTPATPAPPKSGTSSQ